MDRVGGDMRNETINETVLNVLKRLRRTGIALPETGEFLEHESFFVAQFDPQTPEDERQRDDSSDVAEHDHCPNKHD